MTKPLLIGLTGGIGSGKSTIARVFQSLGIPIYYADDRGKALLTEDEQLRKEVTATFGESSYNGDGSLNRQYLAEKVFSNNDELAKLNGLVHPAVARDFETWAKLNSSAPYLIKEAAILFEHGGYEAMDKNIAVMAEKELRKRRVLLRDPQRSAAQVNDILAKQTSDNQRRKLADFLIDNNDSQMVIPQVMEIHQALLSLTSH